jgi:hypothetical protein
MAVGPKVSVLLEHAASVIAAKPRANRRIIFIENIVRSRKLSRGRTETSGIPAQPRIRNDRHRRPSSADAERRRQSRS